MHESANDWYEIDQLRVCVFVSCPVCVCVQCACACARDVQHDMLGPVMVQRAYDLDLRYVHGDDEDLLRDICRSARYLLVEWGHVRSCIRILLWVRSRVCTRTVTDTVVVYIHTAHSTRP